MKKEKSQVLLVRRDTENDTEVVVNRLPYNLWTVKRIAGEAHRRNREAVDNQEAVIWEIRVV